MKSQKLALSRENADVYCAVLMREQTKKEGNLEFQEGALPKEEIVRGLCPYRMKKMPLSVITLGSCTGDFLLLLLTLYPFVVGRSCCKASAS